MFCWTEAWEQWEGIWHLPKSNHGWVIVVKLTLRPQKVITQSSLWTPYFNNLGRERSAYPSLQTCELSFCSLNLHCFTRVLSFLISWRWWTLEHFFHHTFHQTKNSQHTMATVEQSHAAKPIERLPLILKKAEPGPGWVTEWAAPFSALLFPL